MEFPVKNKYIHMIVSKLKKKNLGQPGSKGDVGNPGMVNNKPFDFKNICVYFIMRKGFLNFKIFYTWLILLGWFTWSQG